METLIINGLDERKKAHIDLEKKLNAVVGEGATKQKVNHHIIGNR